jgi:glycosyltransferase involved in cell wall biosynthesis
MTGAAMTERGMRLVIVAGLSDVKLRSKLAPLSALASVTEIALVRRQPLNEPGITDYCPPRWLRSLLPLAEIYRLATLLWLCLHRPKPAYLIAFYTVPHGIYVWFAGRLLGVKAVQVIIGTDLPKVLANRFLVRIIKDADLVGVRGELSSARLRTEGIAGKRLFVTHNVLDLAIYAPQNNEKPLFDLIFVGSLVAVKQIDILLNALALLNQTHQNSRLAIVGEGPLRTELESLASRLNIGEMVTFLGHKDSTEVAGYLKRSRLFVMTSRVEGLPMAMIEALSCGLPVVMPDVGDVTTVARHGENAWIVNPPNAENYAGAIGLILGDINLYAKLREGALQSRAYFQANYSLEAVAGVWEAQLKD